VRFARATPHVDAAVASLKAKGVRRGRALDAADAALKR
jgi:hypothetical protein